MNGISDIHKNCLALTGSFETSTLPPGCYSGVTGNFDGQGMSFGALQWNFGQGTLQPLLSDMLTKHPALSQSLFAGNLPVLAGMLARPLASQILWVRSIQDSRFRLFPSWMKMFHDLGQTAEFQDIQLAYASLYQRNALTLCDRFHVTTERGLALLFDICVQNGSIRPSVEALIRQDFSLLAADDELGRLRSIANRRAEASSSRFIEDVRVRKLTIANGHGTVHGISYDLEKQFGLRLQPFSVSI